jgi:hypothetical protein
MADLLPVKLVYPAGAPTGFETLVWMHRVPVADEIVHMAEREEGGDWLEQEHLEGLSFRVKRVHFTVLKPGDENPPPPEVILER